jgi:hypothetical protein
MLAFVDHAAEAVVSAYFQVGDSVRIGDRVGYCSQWCVLVPGLVRSVLVVMGFELA